MFNMFKPKGYRKVTSLLQQNGFYSDDFRTFQIQLLAQALTSRTPFLFLLQIMRQIKVTSIKALKMVLLCQQLIHILKQVQLRQSLFQFLHQLQIRIHFSLRSLIVTRPVNDIQALSTSVEFIHNSEQLVAMDFNSIIMAKVVVPLIHFQQKIILSYEVVYSARCGNEQQIWFRMNLLRKIVDIGSDIESLGRYYFKQSQYAVISLMKILSYDIQFLYKRIFEFFRKKIVSIQIILQQEQVRSQHLLKEQRIQEFLIMIEELERINQKLRVLYNGRYFVFHLAKINVYIPVLFTGDEHVDLLYKMKTFQSKKNRSIDKRKKCHQQFGQLVQQI